jgi:uncharacterized protein YjbI with pentapeptide repeats
LSSYGASGNSQPTWVEKMRQFWPVALLILIAELAALIAIIAFGLERSDRQQQAYNDSWQAISGTYGQVGNGGRVQALEYLHKEGENLIGLNVEGANLQTVDLEGANLRYANFSALDLEEDFLRTLSIGEIEQMAPRRWDLDPTMVHHYAPDDPDMIVNNKYDEKLSPIELRKANLLQGGFELDKNGDGKILDDTYPNKFGPHLYGAPAENNLGERVDLFGADLRDTQLDNTAMQGASLRCVDLTGATGLTQQQIDQANGNRWTGQHLPKDSEGEQLHPPQHWLHGDQTLEDDECEKHWSDRKDRIPLTGWGKVISRFNLFGLQIRPMGSQSFGD